MGTGFVVAGCQGAALCVTAHHRLKEAIKLAVPEHVFQYLETTTPHGPCMATVRKVTEVKDAHSEMISDSSAKGRRFAENQPELDEHAQNELHGAPSTPFEHAASIAAAHSLLKGSSASRL